MMDRSFASLLIALSLCFAGWGTEPVRMGCGDMTFDTVPGWGLRPDGASPLGPTHGSVVIDQEGYIYTSAKAGVFVFTPEGAVVRSYLGDDYSNIHDMEIRDEDGTEYIYGARNEAGEGIKFKAQGGEIVLRLPFPEASGLALTQFVPTAITVADDGRIFPGGRLRQQHNLHLRPPRQLPAALWGEGPRTQTVPYCSWHDVGYPLRSPSAADLRSRSETEGPAWCITT